MIESMSKDKFEAIKIPQIVTCPHENAAMGMAQGYYFATGKSQAVMTHTNVGLANAICGLINASSEFRRCFSAGARQSPNEAGWDHATHQSDTVRKCAIKQPSSAKA